MEYVVTGVPEREHLMPKYNATTLNTSFGEYEWVIYAVFIQLLIFSVVGSMGNAIVVYIYSNKKEKATSNIFIISLAFVDLLTCLLIIPFTIAMEFIDFRIVYDGLCKAYFFLITFNVPFSMFIMVAIAFDRYFCICHPFLGIMTVKRAKILICVLGLFATSLGLFTSLMHGMYDFKSAFNATAVEAFSLDGFNEGSTMEYTIHQDVSIKKNYEYSYTGICGPNVIIISKSIRMAYQKFYSFLFLVSFVIIAVLYALIVRFVVLKRSWRQKAKYTNTMTTQDTVIDDIATSDIGVAAKTKKKDTIKNGNECESKRTQRKLDKTKEKNQSSNLKIAGMLFVVTLVFVIAFLPGWLIAHQVLPANRLIFYMYFLYNVANPAIYAFMNPVFRKDMERIFNCTKKNELTNLTTT